MALRLATPVITVIEAGYGHPNTKKVDFFIVGQPKSGTTALAMFLSEHPEIGICTPKEPGYFATDLIAESDKFHGRKVFFNTRTKSQYIGLFKKVSQKRLWGDASTNYLYSHTAAKNIKNHNPSAKIIIMLRNPVDFVHSLHMQYRNEVKEPIKSFEEAMELEEARKTGKVRIPGGVTSPSYLFYREQARYSTMIKRYFDLFPEKQIFVLINEEFVKNNEKYFKKIVDFLGANSKYTPKFRKIHSSKKPRSEFLNKLLNNQTFKNTLLHIVGQQKYTSIRNYAAKIMMVRAQREQIDPLYREKLYNEFLPDIQELGGLLSRDLTKIWAE